MTKKKKKSSSGLKAVERGFATTSLPSKSKQIREGEGEEGLDERDDQKKGESGRTKWVDGEADGDDGDLASGGVDAQDARTFLADGKSNPDGIDTLSPEAQEEQHYQNLVEKHCSIIDRKAQRIVRELEYHKRLAASYPTLPLGDDASSIFAEVKRLGHSEYATTSPTLLMGEGSREDLLVRLGTTFQVLKTLGFRPETIEECLRSIRGVDHEEALDWLYLHCESKELLSPIHHRPVQTVDNGDEEETREEMPNGGPSDQNEGSSLSPVSDPVESAASAAAPVAAELGDESEDDLLDIDLTQRFVDLNLELSRLEIHRRQMKKARAKDQAAADGVYDDLVDAAKMARLRNKISAVQSEYYFDSTAAQNALVSAQHQMPL